MIAFTQREVAESIIYAIAFGALYAAVYSAMLLLRTIASDIPDIFHKMLKFDKILPIPDFKTVANNKKTGKIFAFLSVFLFSIGFCILSYTSLDGDLRLYMLVLSSASFYLAKMTFNNFLNKAFLFVFRLILRVITIVLRCFVKPFKMIYHARFQ